jgi:dihydrofolate reductase
MRKLIAGMKISVDGMFEGADGTADWVAAWSEDYGLTPQIDACLLGAGMYPGYERYWTAIQEDPARPAWITGAAPTAAEREWACFAKSTPHYVLSGTLSSARWKQTRFLRTVEDVSRLKQQPGKDIYLIGGARTTASLVDAGLVDELRLIVHPLLAGPGRTLFATSGARRRLELLNAQPLADGRLNLVYSLGPAETGR